MKITVHGSHDEEIWPQLHFTHDKPSPPSTVGTETLESAQKASGIFLDEKKYINVKHYHFILNEKQCIGIKKLINWLHFRQNDSLEILI